MNYIPLSLAADGKYRDDPFTQRSIAKSLSTTTTLDSSAVDDCTSTDNLQQQWMFTTKWTWFLHAVLLLISSTMFFSALFIQSSTLRRVKEFSGYCKAPCSNTKQRELKFILYQAPAASAVDYQAIKFNVSTKGNRFVGKGPQVDKAWQEISYDSK